MMRTRSIGFRLTAWYFAVLAVVLIAFGAVEDTLQDRVRSVGSFIAGQGASLSAEEMRDKFREHSVLGLGGDLFQVSNSKGVWLYRSSALEDAWIPSHSTKKLAKLKKDRLLEDVTIRGEPLRSLSQNVQIRGQYYAVQVAAPLHELTEALDRLFWILAGAIPVILGIASLVGYWMSRRALAPVDEITDAARSINAHSLSQRLSTPKTGDELERLFSTLNAMFERLDEAFSRITQFTADASHELRTPLAFMRATAEVALRRQRTDGEYREALGQILTELERTSTLVENLLLLARADSGAGGMHFQPVDLGLILREACEQGKVLAESKQVEFAFHLPANPILMQGDAQALRRVFVILIDNAVKYTGTGGQIRVDLAEMNGSAFVKVTDSGIGIVEDDLPHIFDRFYRADKARSREMGGAGLGLSSTRWIVEAHDGEIQVESALGRGSAFSVSLPLPARAR
ncbi:MAG: ATP-binding protein [Acidobacteria bacterium]|nr:ATP-binding protein [Acidobacteriota bacterium]